MDDNFKAEVSNGYLLIAIKIPTYTCAACGVVYTPKVNVETVEQLYRGHNSIQSALHTPWCNAGWGHVYGQKVPSPSHFAGYKCSRALVCKDCYAPVSSIETNVEKLKETRNDLVAAKVTAWET